MKIMAQLNNEINKKIKIQLTNPNNPLILYLLELNEEEYKNILDKQKILINFDEFPNFLLNLINLCVDKRQNYFTSLYLDDSPEVIFIVEEKIKFKITEHLRLKLRKANDEEIKKYLSQIYINLKNRFIDTFNKLNEINIKNEYLSKENILINETNKKNEYDSKNTINILINEKNNEIISNKDEHIKELKKQKELYENEKQNYISKYEKKISDMQIKIDILTKNKYELEDQLLKYEIQNKNYEGKYEISNNELNKKIKENKIIMSDNKSIQKKYIDMEREFDELKYKNEALQIELEESKKNNFKYNYRIFKETNRIK